MRFFSLLSVRHIVLFVFPAIVFIILFWLGLKHTHFQTKDSEERERRILHVFPGGIEERDAPFPLVLLLIIVGFVLWGFFYALGMGLMGARI